MEKTRTEPKAVATPPSSLVPIPLTTLTPGRVVDFPLFTELAGERLLYHRKGTVLTKERRDNLLRSGELRVFIPEDELRTYYRMLENDIRELLSPTDDLEEAAQVHYSVGQVVARQLLDDPASAEGTVFTWVESFQSLLDGRDGVLTQFSRVLDVAPDLYAHSLHVCVYGLALARYAEVGDLRDGSLTDFGIGLLLHDVGLLSVPCEWRQRRGPLSPVEQRVVQAHTRDGLEQVEPIDWVGPIAREVIRDHHELLDGSGYPERKLGAQLSPFVRIASLVNAFDRRTTQRPFRGAQPTSQALRDLIGNEAGRYDPRLLAAFVRMLKV